MAIVLGAGYSVSLDSVGCFRTEIAKACGENAASLRRWHGDQVKAGRLQEGRDFVVVRQAPDEKHHDDDVFYFWIAIQLCQQRRQGKRIDITLLNLKTLRQHGLQVIKGQVVRREQLSIFSIPQSELPENKFSKVEASNSDIFSTVTQRQFKGVKISQRRTDGYLNANSLCGAGNKQWHKFKAQLENPKTELGAYLALFASKMQMDKSILIQKLQDSESGLKGTWIHPSIAHRIAQEISLALAAAVDSWNLDIYSRSLHPNPIDIEREFSEFKKGINRDIDRLGQEIERLKGEQLRSRLFSDWNRKISYHTAGKIIYPLEHWEVFRKRPTKETKTNFPFVYIIIVYPQHELQGHPDVFYVGLSGNQPSNRFSDHDGLKSIEAIEKYGYNYEVRYYESNLFQVPGELQIVEKALQVALRPYWECLTPEQKTLIQQGKLLKTDNLFTRLFTREELSIVS